MATGQQIASLYAKIGADTSDLKRGLRDSEIAMGSTANKFRSAGDLMGAAFRSPGFAAAGLAITIGTALVGATIDATKGAMELSRRLSEVKAVSQATTAEIATLRETAKTLGSQYGMTANDMASGMVDLAKAGLTAQDIANGAAKATATLAAAGGVSMAEAAEIGATSMAVWGMSARDMARVADIVAGAANASVIGVNDFRLSLSMAGAVSAMANQSFESTATAIAILGKNGIKNSDAGTSLKQMMLNLVPASDKAREAMERLGIITADGTNRFFDAEGKAKSYAEIAQVLQNSLAGLTQQEKLQNLEIIFGSDAIRSATIMAKEGESGFNAMAAAINKVSAATVAADRLDNASGAMQRAGTEARALADDLGQKAEPAVKAFFNRLAGEIHWIREFAQSARDADSAVAGMGMTAEGAAPRISGLGSSARNTAKDINDLVAAWKAGQVMQGTDFTKMGNAISARTVSGKSLSEIEKEGMAGYYTWKEGKDREADAADRERAANAWKASEDTRQWYEDQEKAKQQASERAASAAASAWNKAMESARDGVSKLRQMLQDLSNRKITGTQAIEDQGFALDQAIAAQEIKIYGMQKKGIKGRALRTEEKKLQDLQDQRSNLSNVAAVTLGPGQRAVDRALNPPQPELSPTELVDLITRTRTSVQQAESAVQIADQNNSIYITVPGTNASPEEIAAAVVEAIGGSVASFEVGAKPTLAGARR